MLKYSSNTNIPSKMPFNKGNRDENFLIEYDGILLHECDVYFYGLLHSSIADDFPYIRDTTTINPNKIYHELGFYYKNDLLHRLRGLKIDDEWDYHLSYDEVRDIAFSNYNYIHYSESTLIHALLEAAIFDFVKSITLSITRELSNSDIRFLNTILPKDIRDKLVIANSDIRTVVDEKKLNYTTIVNTSYDTSKYIVENRDILGVNSSLVLLRNHSGNVKMSMENGIYKFEEVGTNEIVRNIVTEKSMLPKNPMKFARFEPSLFIDTYTKMEDRPDEPKK